MAIDNNELGRYITAVLSNQRLIMTVLASLLEYHAHCNADGDLVAAVRKAVEVNEDALKTIEKRVDGVGIAEGIGG